MAIRSLNVKDGDIVAVRDGFIVLRKGFEKPKVKILLPDRTSIEIDVPSWKNYSSNSGVLSSDKQLWFIEDGDGGVYILDVANRAVIGKFFAHGDLIHGMALSPDERYFVTVGNDGFIRVWGIVPEGVPAQ